MGLFAFACLCHLLPQCCFSLLASYLSLYREHVFLFFFPFYFLLLVATVIYSSVCLVSLWKCLLLLFFLLSGCIQPTFYSSFVYISLIVQVKQNLLLGLQHILVQDYVTDGTRITYGVKHKINLVTMWFFLFFLFLHETKLDFFCVCVNLTLYTMLFWPTVLKAFFS